MFDWTRWPPIVGDDLGPLGRIVHDSTGHFDMRGILAQQPAKSAMCVGFLEFGSFWDAEQQKHCQCTDDSEGEERGSVTPGRVVD